MDEWSIVAASFLRCKSMMLPMFSLVLSSLSPHLISNLLHIDQVKNAVRFVGDGISVHLC